MGSTWSRARPRRSHHSAKRRTAERYARRVLELRMWAVKNSQNRRSACSVGEKSAGVVVRGAGAAAAEASMGSRSGNMGGACTPIEVVHKGRYVTYRERHEHYRPSPPSVQACIDQAVSRSAARRRSSPACQ